MTAPVGQVRQSSDAGLPAETLFVDPAFVAFQAQAQGKRLATFQAGDDLASLSFAGRDGVWANPVTGAFGGLGGAPTSPGMVEALVDAATAWLRDQSGGRQASLRLPPDCFADPNAAALENALFRSGWRLDQVDLNHYLAIAGVEAFTRALGETKQKELRRLKRSGAAFRSLSLDEARPAYEVIARNRAARGYPMTMAWTQVEALARAFPGRVGLHAVEREGVILAAAVLLQVTARYLYVFYWGEDPQVRRESPVTLLAEGLVGMRQAQGVEVLDIGTSTDRSRPNPGLIAFKESLGCRAAGKRTYVLDIVPSPGATPQDGKREDGV